MPNELKCAVEDEDQKDTEERCLFFILVLLLFICNSDGARQQNQPEQ